MKKKKYTHHRAQMTCPLSFGPFPISVAFQLSLYRSVTPVCARVVVVFVV